MSFFSVSTFKHRILYKMIVENRVVSVEEYDNDYGDISISGFWEYLPKKIFKCKIPYTNIADDVTLGDNLLSDDIYYEFTVGYERREGFLYILTLYGEDLRESISILTLCGII